MGRRTRRSAAFAADPSPSNRKGGQDTGRKSVSQDSGANHDGKSSRRQKQTPLHEDLNMQVRQGQIPKDAVVTSFAKCDAGSSTLATTEVLYRVQWFDKVTFEPAGQDPVTPAKAVYNALFNLEQNFTGPVLAGGGKPDGQVQLLARPHELWVYAYPTSLQGSNLNADNIFTVLSSVPVENKSNGNQTELFNSNQQATNIPPTFNPKWQLVNHVNYSQLFEDAQVQPYVTFGAFQRLIQLSVVNPYTFATINAQEFAFKFILTFKQTQPTSTFISAQLGYTPSFSNAAEEVTGSVAEQPALVQPVKMTHNT